MSICGGQSIHLFDYYGSILHSQTTLGIKEIALGIRGVRWRSVGEVSEEEEHSSKQGHSR
ncbi:hypothetical protein NITLEN_20395 [Nitrospira lenta]|uniref:Uncharacterized protein n=1 Tax=Nitrospira lenta TaxID=1436998 RepID=A0A330L700_9BACT|nr:hypothetical protein NITLEN_20395 [Nitrospira lenta]